MIDVKKPILLDSSLADSAMLHPSKGTMKLEMVGVSEATLTLTEADEGIPMHGWVKMYNQLGFVGVFRRTSRDNNVTVDKTYTLKHGIDILQDSVWAAETDFTGTKTEFLTALLNQQTHLIGGVKPWVLGSCADTSTVTKKINYDNLLDLLMGQVEEGGDYYYTYDQTVWPWTVSLVAKPSAVASEFRLNRNIEKCKIKDNDAELCTRLILSVNEMVNDTARATSTGVTVKQNQAVIRTYDNASAQASYGVIVKTADIDVTQDTFPNGPFPEADAWAADFLARRAAPLLQVQIDGFVLKGITGDDWDESKIATMCRVALPDYADAITERVVTVSYPDLYGTPDKVTVSLANAQPTYTKSMKAAQKEVSRLGSSGRGSARKEESFDQHFQITDTAGSVLKQAGMHLDADGLLVYADDNVNNVGAKFNVQADKIGMVVGTNQSGNFIKAGEICLAINNSGESTATINANKIYLLGQTIANTITADYIGTKIGQISQLSVQSIAASGTISANRLNGDSIYFRHSAGAGYTYTDVKNAAMSSVTLTDNGDNTYTLKSYKIDGTETVIGNFNRGGGGSVADDDIQINNYTTTNTAPTAPSGGILTQAQNLYRSITAGQTAGHTYCYFDAYVNNTNAKKRYWFYL